MLILIVTLRSSSAAIDSIMFSSLSESFIKIGCLLDFPLFFATPALWYYFIIFKQFELVETFYSHLQLLLNLALNLNFRFEKFITISWRILYNLFSRSFWLCVKYFLYLPYFRFERMVLKLCWRFLENSK